MSQIKSLQLVGAGFFAGAAVVAMFEGIKPKSEVVPVPTATNNLNPNSKIERFGLPLSGQYQRYPSFTSFVDYRLKIPSFVLEHITPEGMSGPGNRKYSKFVQDVTIPEQFRPTEKDYEAMNNIPMTRMLSRGHMAPAGNNKMTQDAMNATFLLGTNILPQEYNQNAGRWNMLEEFARNLAKSNKFQNVYVMSGPLFLPTTDPKTKRKYVTYEVIGEKNVAVPTHLYKVIAVEDKNGRVGVGAFVMPNEPIDSTHPISEYLVPVSYVETHAGLRVFPTIFKGQSVHEQQYENLCSLTECKVKNSVSNWERCNKFTAEVAKATTRHELMLCFEDATKNNCQKDRTFANMYKKKNSSPYVV